MTAALTWDRPAVTVRPAGRYGWVRAAVTVTRPLAWDRAAVTVTPPPGALLEAAAYWEPFQHPRDHRGRFAPSSTLGPDHIPWEHSTQMARAHELRAGDVIGSYTIAKVEHGSARGTTRIIFSGGARVTVRDDYRPMGVRRASYGGESFFSKKATHHADPAIKDITSIHGNRLHVAGDGLGWDTTAVQRHLRGMQEVPALHQRFLARSHVEIWIGTKPTTEQDQMGRLSGVHPPGYPAGDTYDQCGALFSHPRYDTARKPVHGKLYNPPMTSPGKIVLGNQVGSGSVNTAAHEMGHALDAFLGEDVFWRGTGGMLSMHPDFTAIHDRLAARSLPGGDARFASDWAVNPYYVQEGSRGQGEAFAEGYAAWVHTAGRPSKFRAEEIMDALGFVPTPSARWDPALLRRVTAYKRQLGADLIAYFDGLDARIKGARKRLPPPHPKRQAA